MFVVLPISFTNVHTTHGVLLVATQRDPCVEAIRNALNIISTQATHNDQNKTVLPIAFFLTILPTFINTLSVENFLSKSGQFR